MKNESLCVFKISFEKIFSDISDKELNEIASLNVESSFDCEKDSLYYCYVISSKIEMNKYIKILERNYIEFEYLDISEKLLKNEYDISYLKDYLTDENYYIYDIFTQDLDKWIYSKLDLDIVLDMISKNGINSLRNIDKYFLKENYSK